MSVGIAFVPAFTTCAKYRLVSPLPRRLSVSLSLACSGHTLLLRSWLPLHGAADQFPKIDVTIDGADDVDLALNAIKGGGACHLREKVLAEAADDFIIIADHRKNNVLLGDVRRACPC